MFSKQQNKQKRKQTALRLLVVSLIAFLAVSCKSGPEISICISDAIGGYDCYDKAQDKEFYLDYKDSLNYIAMSPDDAEALMEYWELKCFGDRPLDSDSTLEFIERIINGQ